MMFGWFKKKKHTVSDDTADLFLRMQSGEAGEDELARMADWADDAPERLAELEEMSAVWDKVGDVRPDPALLKDTPAEAASGGGTIRAFFEKMTVPQFVVSGAAVAAMLMVAVFSVGGGFGPDPVSYATARGETRQVALADGSQLALNGLSGVDVAFEGSKRVVRMDRGEVYFDVAPDKNKPFVVMVGETTVSVVGTEFNIERLAEKLIITVTEGIVDISLPDHVEHASRSVRAEVGMKVSISDKSDAGVSETKLSAEDLAAAASWRTGTVHFSGERLSNAVEKLNRRAKKRIIIGRKELGDIPIFGSFDLNDTDAFLSAIEGLHGLRRTERDGAIYLFPKRAGE